MMLRFLCLTLAASGAWTAAADDSWQRQFLSNEGLVQLARAGYGERFLVELIHGQPTRFDTSVEGLVYLAKNGMSERIVRMMIAAKKRADDMEEAEYSGKPVPAMPTSTSGHAPWPATGASAGHAGGHPAPHAPAPAAGSSPPLRLRTVKRKVLMPESLAQTRPGDQLIVLDPRWVEIR